MSRQIENQSWTRLGSKSLLHLNAELFNLVELKTTHQHSGDDPMSSMADPLWRAANDFVLLQCCSNGQTNVNEWLHLTMQTVTRTSPQIRLIRLNRLSISTHSWLAKCPLRHGKCLSISQFEQTSTQQLYSYIKVRVTAAIMRCCQTCQHFFERRESP